MCRRARRRSGGSNVCCTAATRVTAMAGCGTCVPVGRRRRALTRSAHDIEAGHVEHVEPAVVRVAAGGHVPRPQRTGRSWRRRSGPATTSGGPPGERRTSAGGRRAAPTRGRHGNATPSGPEAWASSPVPPTVRAQVAAEEAAAPAARSLAGGPARRRRGPRRRCAPAPPGRRRARGPAGPTAGPSLIVTRRRRRPPSTPPPRHGTVARGRRPRRGAWSRPGPGRRAGAAGR